MVDCVSTCPEGGPYKSRALGFAETVLRSRKALETTARSSERLGRSSKASKDVRNWSLFGH